MTDKKTGKANQIEAADVFRQFAWNLAGTLSRKPPARRVQRKPAGRA